MLDTPELAGVLQSTILDAMKTSPPFETISHYRLHELLGRGAMGEVWLAEDLQLPRRVAVPDLASLHGHPEFIRMFGSGPPT